MLQLRQTKCPNLDTTISSKGLPAKNRSDTWEISQQSKQGQAKKVELTTCLRNPETLHTKKLRQTGKDLRLHKPIYSVSTTRQIRVDQTIDLNYSSHGDMTLRVFHKHKMQNL